MQQMYMRAPMPKCDFNKVAKHKRMHRVHIFRTAFLKNTSERLFLLIYLSFQVSKSCYLVKPPGNQYLEFQVAVKSKKSKNEWAKKDAPWIGLLESGRLVEGCAYSIVNNQNWILTYKMVVICKIWGLLEKQYSIRQKKLERVNNRDSK